MKSHMMNVNYTGSEKSSNIYTKRLSLTLRKYFWDCHLDSQLSNNDVCLHLAHQAVSDLRQGPEPMTEGVKYQLDHFIITKSDRLSLIASLDSAETLQCHPHMHLNSSYSDCLSVICDINRSAACNSSTLQVLEFRSFITWVNWKVHSMNTKLVLILTEYQSLCRLAVCNCSFALHSRQPLVMMSLARHQWTVLADSIDLAVVE